MHTNKRCPFQYRDARASASLPFLLGRKWEFPVLNAVYANGDMRYNELKHGLNGITSRALSQALDRLCERRLLRKSRLSRVNSQSDQSARYSLTGSGRQLLRLISMSLEINGQHSDGFVHCPILLASQLVEDA